MALWGRNNLPSKMSPPEIIKPGEGVNTYVNAFEITKNEASESSNVSNRDYPALTPRPGISSVDFLLTKVNGVTYRVTTGTFETSEFHVVDGTTWKYITGPGPTYTDIATGLADAEATFLEFNTAAKKNTVMFNGTDKKYWDGTNVFDITDVNCPSTNIITADDSRMFALKDATLSVSDIGDITNWTSGDSDKIVLTGMIGLGTALIIYNDMIISWSNQTMHIVYGKTKDEFQVTEPIPVGNYSRKSTIIHGMSGVLYWYDYEKIMAFTGGLPFEVGQKVTKYLKRIVLPDKVIMSQFGRYIYVSIAYYPGAGPIPTSNNLTLEYDTERNLWYVWDYGFDNFISLGEDLYGVSTDGYLELINEDSTVDIVDAVSTPITWSHTMGVSNFKPLKNLKHITDMYAIIDLPVGSQLLLQYSTSIDGSDFKILKTFTSDSDEQNVRVRIPTTELQRINWYRLRFFGEGPSKVHYLEVHGRNGE